MNAHNRLVFSLLMTIFFFSSAKDLRAQSAELKRLAEFMTGSYSSREQHLQDTVNFFDIRLLIIPIWKKRSDGYWFYVEQAVAEYRSKPYRQRVYHVTEPEKGIFQSTIFTFSEPLRFTGKPELLEQTLTVDSLKEKEGCEVILRSDGKNFVGSTQGQKCPSDRKGAAYATAVVTITSSTLESWDRGYNEKGEQVWGAEKGGYVFNKATEQE